MNDTEARCSKALCQGFPYIRISYFTRACEMMLAFWFGTCLWAQDAQKLTPEEWVWAVKSETSVLLRSVPNYVCLESIVAKSFGGARFKPDQYDSAQIEVAFIEGQEWYSFRGERRFSSTKVSKLLGPAFATTGLYSSLPRGLMGTSAQGVQFVKQTDLGGEQVGLFRFNTSNSKPSWAIQLNGRRALATKQGTFWASAETLLLKRVSVDATHIVPDIGLKTLHIDVQYDVRSLSEKRVLLPSSAQIWATESDGQRNVSDALFTHCRAYQAESSISFGDQTISASSAAQPLPSGIHFSTVLANSIEWPSIVAHQPVLSTITHPISWKGRIFVPAGAVLEGSVERIRWLPEYEMFQIVFEFDKLELPDGVRPFYGHLLSLSPSYGVQRKITELDRVQAQSRLDAKRESTILPDIIEPNAPGSLTVYMRGKSFIPKGLQIEWQTESPSQPYDSSRSSPSRDTRSADKMREWAGQNFDPEKFSAKLPLVTVMLGLPPVVRGAIQSIRSTFRCMRGRFN